VVFGDVCRQQGSPPANSTFHLVSFTFLPAERHLAFIRKLFLRMLYLPRPFVAFSSPRPHFALAFYPSRLNCTKRESSCPNVPTPTRFSPWWRPLFPCRAGVHLHFVMLLVILTLGQVCRLRLAPPQLESDHANVIPWITRPQSSLSTLETLVGARSLVCPQFPPPLFSKAERGHVVSRPLAKRSNLVLFVR